MTLIMQHVVDYHVMVVLASLGRSNYSITVVIVMAVLRSFKAQELR